MSSPSSIGAFEKPLRVPGAPASPPTNPHSPRRNLELKAKDPDPARSRAVCERIGATACGVLAQLDTYFVVPGGRLKLREQDGSSAQLIAYQRADTAQQRESRYRIVEVDSAAELKAALTESLGIEAVVSKRRRLFIWNGVRIHLDEIGELGTFIELEAVAAADSDLSAEGDLVRVLREEFALGDAELISASYCDLIAERGRQPGSPVAEKLAA